MFDSLSSKLDKVFKKLGRRGVLKEDDIKKSLREIKIALLEADVNYRVVKKFIKNVEKEAMGEKVLKSLKPSEQVIKIVKDELIDIMGKAEKIDLSTSPTIIMLMGLQGAGKTTAAAKLANKFKNEGKKPYLIGADLRRPAAIEQLYQLGEEINVQVYSNKKTKDVAKVIRNGIKEAKKYFSNVIIMDTSGRMHIDEELMREIDMINKQFQPHEKLLVVDAMTGQDAVNVAEGFEKKVGIDGVILTKLDGDARGGAALSLRMVTGKPIKYIGVGEKVSDIEKFHPDRIVSRMLGMGDVLTLIEKAEQSIKKDEAKKLEDQIRKGQFTLQDFLDQIKMIKKMGPLNKIMKMIPGMPKDLDIDDKEIVKVESIIQSMTPKERLKPKIIKASRKRRIAKGCGRSVADINRLLRRYKKSKKMLKQIGGKFGKKGMNIPNMFK